MPDAAATCDHGGAIQMLCTRRKKQTKKQEQPDTSMSVAAILCIYACWGAWLLGRGRTPLPMTAERLSKSPAKEFSAR